DRHCSSGKWSDVQCIRADHRRQDTCVALQTFAQDFGINPGFFARLIWQESRFDPNALSHANAMGIAQFIRSTADLRGLDDPYNPAMALEHSAQYLAELSEKFGNLGMAAAAYNGGEGRVERSFDGGGFARETIDYVNIITGHAIESWKTAPYPTADYRLDGDTPFLEACLEMAGSGRFTPQRALPPPLKPWAVRLAWGSSRDRALAAYRSNTTSCREILGPEKLDLVTVPNRLRGKPPFVMAHIGRNSRQAAGALCRELNALGCVCRVFRNP
ncbi:MAG: lytic transglycosylase domain-containing protein, partial [Pseudomonadota bacterium]